ncbi:MAG: PAS domain-containing sensor histidine kinase [Balneolaceae bacterium]|nr:MAG: PAS domain-containing sensor histidine kinase [Balneolaceae bacterium]
MPNAESTELYTSSELSNLLSVISALMLTGDDEKKALGQAFGKLGPFISASKLIYYERTGGSTSDYSPTVVWNGNNGAPLPVPGLPAGKKSPWHQLLSGGSSVQASPLNDYGLPASLIENGEVLIVPVKTIAGLMSFICVMTGQSEQSGHEMTGVIKTLLCAIGSHLQNRSIEAALLRSEQRYNQIFRNNPAVKFLIEPETGRIVDANRAACQFYGYSYTQFLTINISDINTLPPDDVKSRIDEVIRNGGSLFHFNHRKADGEIREVEVYTAPVLLSGKTLLYSIIHDVTDRTLAQEKLRIGEMLFRQFVFSTPAAVAMFDTDMNYLLTSKRWIEDFKLSNTALQGISLYETFPDIPDGWKKVLDAALAGSTASSDEELVGLPDGSKEWIRWEIQPWYRKQDTIGGIIIFTELITERKKAAEAEKNLIRQKVRLASRLETIEEERRKISRELHDGLGQMITAAVMNVELIDNALRTQPDKAIEYVESVKSLLNTTIQEVRNISQDLRPAILDDFGLTPALRLLCEDFSKVSGIDITMGAFDMNDRLPSRLEITLYRICQEAISNIVRHADATEAGIQMYRRSNTILVVIQDNGKGFDRGLIRTDLSRSGSGLTNIKERVELHNGRLQIESAPGQGMELIIEIPLDNTTETSAAEQGLPFEG